MMALKELKELGEKILLLAPNDPQWSYQVQDLEAISKKYKTFARTLQHQLMKRSSDAQPLLMASLETEYNRSNITWLPDETSMDEADKRITYYQNRSYYGYAHILQIRRLMEHPNLAREESNRLIDCRLHFLNSFQKVLEIEDVKEHVPSWLADSQLFLPRCLVKISSFMNHLRAVGLRDCLGRTTSHIAFDAELDDAWIEAHINDGDVLGRTAMHLVCQVGNEDLVSKYLTTISTLESKTVIGTTPLHNAASKGHLKICRQMMECLTHNPVSILGMDDCIGRTPLAYAASHGHNLTANFLLSQNIVHERGHSDYFGNTPLSLAVRYGHVHMVRLLLNYNFIVDELDENGRTAFWHAVHDSRYEMMVILEPFTDIDHRDYGGRTPLLEAASHGFSEGVRFLLSLSYDAVQGRGKPRLNPYFMNKKFETSIQLASASGNEECVRLLVDHFKETWAWYQDNYAVVIADVPKLPFEWKKIFGSPKDTASQYYQSLD